MMGCFTIVVLFAAGALFYEGYVWPAVAVLGIAGLSALADAWMERKED